MAYVRSLVRALLRSSSLSVAGLLSFLAAGCGAPPAPPPPPVAPSAAPAAAPEPPSPAELAKQALLCPLLANGEFAPGCAALDAFLAPTVVRSPRGRAELGALVVSKDVKAQALAARGYAAAVDKTAALTVEELGPVLVLFESTQQIALVKQLGPVIRATVASRPAGPEAAALASFLAREGQGALSNNGPKERADALVEGNPPDDLTIPTLLFHGREDWSRVIGRYHLMAAPLAPAERCKVLTTDLARGGDPEQNYVDAVRIGCAPVERLAIAAIVERAKQASWLEASQTILRWPFEDLVPLCAKHEDRRPTIASALQEVIAGGPGVESKIRERALDDLAACDRDAAKQLAKGLAKDKDPEIAAAAKVLLRPEPKTKPDPKKKPTKR